MLNAMRFSHQLLEETINRFPSGLFIDATLGNGHDSYFILSNKNFKGRLLSFDIQARAILNSYQRINQLQTTSASYQFIHASHDTLFNYLNSNSLIHGAIFNLGYLPGGDHQITTHSHSTLNALQQIMSRLVRKGRILIVIYSGHSEGQVEKEQLLNYLKAIDQQAYHIYHYHALNQKNNPPELLAIERI